MSEINIRERKKQVRVLIKERKAALSRDQKMEASARVFKVVEELPEFQSAKTVLAYWSLPDEIFTHDFVKKWFLSKRLLLPLVVGDRLQLSVFSGPQSMVETPPYGILEPTGEELVDVSEVDIIIVPGLAFDEHGNRLGRGKGYYDKLLTDAKAYKVGVCFQIQCLSNVPVDHYDVPVDKVVFA